MRRNTTMGAKGARIARALLAFAGLMVLATAAGAQDVGDLTLSGAPGYSPVAPVARYLPDADATRSGPPVLGGDGTIDSLPQQVEADIDTLGYTSLDNVALIMDRDATDSLYIKVQGQSGTGKFDSIGFYHFTTGGSGPTGWSNMTGGPAFFLFTDPNDQFQTAHMTVIHDGAGTVTLRLTNIDGGGKTLEYTRGGWVPRNSNAGGFGGYAGHYAVDNWGLGSPLDYVCDTFDRANGGLGGNWVTTDGTGSIVGNTGRGSSVSRSIFIGSCQGGIGQEVEADVSLAVTGLDYCALVLNYDGADNLYVKVQRQGTSGTTFTHVGIYDSVNGLGWPGQTGGPSFFALPVEQQFQTAHMHVTVDGGGTVRLILTQIDGGTGMLEFQRGGWPFRNGAGAGFGGYAGSNIIDNWGTGGHVCDEFNRANGPLGPQWVVTDGTAAILNHAARGNSTSRAIFTGACGVCVDTTSPLVSITGPTAFSCACANVTISGSVSDPDGEYIGDVLEYRSVSSPTWIVAGNANGPRTGTLYTWNTGALPEGYYYLRVTGHNGCNLSASDTALIWISRTFDSAIIRSPGAGAILGGIVCVDGSAWDNNCFDSYTLMYKPLVGGSYAPVDPNTPVYTNWVYTDPLGSWNTASGPTAVPDGEYLIRLHGLDRCGNVGEVIRQVRIDNTAPVATITSPLACTPVHGTVQVTGTANDANLSGWSLQYTGGNEHGWVTIASGNTPVINGVLGNWNTSRLPNCAYTLRLVVSDLAGVNCSGFTHSAEYYVSVGLNWNKLGDMNCDGVVNFDDINPFVSCLTNGGDCSCP